MLNSHSGKDILEMKFNTLKSIRKILMRKYKIKNKNDIPTVIEKFKQKRQATAQRMRRYKKILLRTRGKGTLQFGKHLRKKLSETSGPISVKRENTIMKMLRV